MGKLLENLWVKIAALILAVLLWFHVATDKTYQNKITLPLKQVEITGDLALTEPPPDSVQCRNTTIPLAGMETISSNSDTNLILLIVTLVETP